MKSIAVFCGANSGNNPVYAEAATQLGHLMAAKSIGLVFGGGKVGLMGTIADSVLAKGGQAVGVIPQSLVDREQAHTGLTEQHIVKTMHERKALMASKSDAFVAMPGGFGTLDEINEIITWNQLGIIQKPVAFFNVNGYYDKFMAFLADCVQEGLIKPEYMKNLIVESEPEVLLQKLTRYADTVSEDWVDSERI
ncbi:LOG family protein [Pontibacter chinhatensis]|uniref:Cytokinin riboside 5'-monophosphate phosphoribohydrolase n=1 Tax=Pontibacter chinhatensis TaxID=1436961 RepID=A0A1I2YQJ4_9BACT|nr:TIGR00730 family Rossman fold protein [Pontibacter chinhatensis]SFH27924.1 hypothetical protein SAMN05421739_10975 [Pontibacter chinhatensis]